MSNGDIGQPPAGPTTTGQIICPNCNGANPPDAANCMWCGKPLPDTAGAMPSSSEKSDNSPALTQPPVQPLDQQPEPQAYQPYTGYAQPPTTAQTLQNVGTSAPQYPQPAPVVTAPPPEAKPVSGSKSKLPLILGGALLGLLLLCALGFLAFGSIFTGVMGVTQPAADAGEKFMVALRDGNYDRAFELSTPTLQQDLGNAQALQSALASKRPTGWTITSRSINNDLATLNGTATYAGNASGTLEMELRKIGNDWKVSFINLK